tara:strand:- start:46 stop:258 length:213 start_codon:yes stop_codon:yes gene_type:complete
MNIGKIEDTSKIIGKELLPNNTVRFIYLLTSNTDSGETDKDGNKLFTDSSTTYDYPPDDPNYTWAKGLLD